MRARPWGRWVMGAGLLAMIAVPHRAAGQASSSEAATDEAAFRARVEASWAVRLKDDRAASYEFFSPKAKQVVPRDEFLRMGGRSIRYVSAQVVAWELEGDVGVVGVEVEYRVMHPLVLARPPLKKFLKERWVRLDDIWYRDFDEAEFGLLRAFRERARESAPPAFREGGQEAAPPGMGLRP